MPILRSTMEQGKSLSASDRLRKCDYRVVHRLIMGAIETRNRFLLRNSECHMVAFRIDYVAHL